MSEPAGAESKLSVRVTSELLELLRMELEVGNVEAARDMLRRRLRREWEDGRLTGRREIRDGGGWHLNPWSRSGGLPPSEQTGPE